MAGEYVWTVIETVVTLHSKDYRTDRSCRITIVPEWRIATASQSGQTGRLIATRVVGEVVAEDVSGPTDGLQKPRFGRVRFNALTNP